jgi:PilZ domain-containing protein
MSGIISTGQAPKRGETMKHARVRSSRVPHRSHLVCDRRTEHRLPVDFRLMYSGQAEHEDLVMGDGSVVDLSNQGLHIRGTVAVKAGLEITLFLYLPDGRDPLFVLSAKVAWSRGHQFGVEILKMNVRERNRLRYFLASNLHH